MFVAADLTAARDCADLAAAARERLGEMEALGFELRAEAVLRTLTEDVLKFGEIEGESLDKAQVRFSIASRLGMDVGALAPADRDVEGAVSTSPLGCSGFRAVSTARSTEPRRSRPTSFARRASAR